MASQKEMRAWLAGKAEENREEIWTALWNAVNAETARNGKCPNCRRDVYVNIPDTAARANAVKILMEQGFGRPKETVEHQVTHKPLDQLTNEELERELARLSQ